MKAILKFRVLLLAALSLIMITACNRGGDDGHSGENRDPLIAYWKLKAVTVSGQTADVSNEQCWKDSYMNVDATTAKLNLVLPNNGTCATSAESYQWTNKNGVYYYTENGQQVKMPVTLLDNNATLQLNISDGQNTVIFSFRK